MERIICPFHKGQNGKDERTPSLVVYEDGYKCYSCGANGPLSKLSLPPGFVPTALRPPENLNASLKRIVSLPLAPVRGLNLPVDGDSYYIVWPGDNYYKRRKFLSNDGPKYLCPVGHKKPLFVPYEKQGGMLAIVEGEINALSLAQTQPNYSVCSPGGSADFFGKNFDKYSKYYLTYTMFLVIVDKDAAGVEAAIKIKKLLLEHTPYIDVRLMAKDCNDLLQAGTLTQEVSSWGSIQGWKKSGNVAKDVTCRRASSASTLKS